MSIAAGIWIALFKRTSSLFLASILEIAYLPFENSSGRSTKVLTVGVQIHLYDRITSGVRFQFMSRRW